MVRGNWPTLISLLDWGTRACGNKMTIVTDDGNWPFRALSAGRVVAFSLVYWRGIEIKGWTNHAGTVFHMLFRDCARWHHAPSVFIRYEVKSRCPPRSASRMPKQPAKPTIAGGDHLALGLRPSALAPARLEQAPFGESEAHYIGSSPNA